MNFVKLIKRSIILSIGVVIFMQLDYYFILFIIYSFLGWLMEITLTLILKRKFVDRGFLIGPYCPIYGFGALLIMDLLENYTDNWLVLFILAMVICMILEYLTSYLMEVIFKARWWDYSNKKFNINGRICLETTIPFGLGALLLAYVLHPFFSSLIMNINDTILLVIATFIFALFLVDLIVSFNVISKFKNAEIKIKRDDTEEITRKVREYLLNHSKLTKRLVNAFPNAQAVFYEIKEKAKEKATKIKKFYNF